MKINELGSEYMVEYNESDVVITECRSFCDDEVIVFDLSDGTHWLGDWSGNWQTLEKLTDAYDIIYDDNDGWMRLGRNGHRYPINWVD